MKKWVFTILISVNAFSMDTVLEERLAQLSKGKYSLSGSAGAGYATGGVGFFAHGDVSAMYYLMDNLSIGIDGSFSHYTGYDRFMGFIGPTVQYNFYNNKLLSSYIKLSYMTDIDRLFLTHMIRSDIGIDFWLNKTFTLGPYIRTTYLIDTPVPTFSNNVGARLGIHF